MTGLKHPDATPWVQHQQILVPGHNYGGSGGESQLQVTVVLGIPAVQDLLCRINPKCGRRQQFKDFAPPVISQNPSELRPGQHLGDFAENRVGQGDSASGTSGGQGTPGRSVRI